MQLCKLTYIHPICIISTCLMHNLKFCFLSSYAHDDLDTGRTAMKKDCAAAKDASENSAKRVNTASSKYF